MTIPTFSRWLKRTVSPTHVPRLPASRPGRRRYRPVLQELETRCLLTTVLNLNDSGADSLR